MFLSRNACSCAQLSECVFQEIVQPADIGRSGAVGGKPEVENSVVALYSPADSEVVADRHIGVKSNHLPAEKEERVLRTRNIGTYQIEWRSRCGGGERREQRLDRGRSQSHPGAAELNQIGDEGNLQYF